METGSGIVHQQGQDPIRSEEPSKEQHSFGLGIKRLPWDWADTTYGTIQHALAPSVPAVCM